MSIRSFVEELDWSAPVRKVDVHKHWRLLVCVFFFAVASACIFHRVFPDVLWFLVLWCGLVTGATVGLLPGAVWQLASRERQGSTSGKFIVTSFLAWGFFSLVAILILLPLMRAHESERSGFRALAVEDVVSIGVFGRRKSVITSKPAIDRFMTQVAVSELYYPSHEISSQELKLSFSFKDGRSAEFAAGVPERHPKDISVETGVGEMLVPGGPALLEEATN
jgi:hypothetical protein